MNTNHVESFFSGVQRVYVGIHPSLLGEVFRLVRGGNHIARGHRRVDNGTQMRGMVHFAPSRTTSRNLCGYWEGNKPPMRLGDRPPLDQDA